MNLWLIQFVAGGLAFFPGLACIALAVLIRVRGNSKWPTRLSIFLAIIGVMLVVLSAESLPYGLYTLWAAGIATWFFTWRARRRSLLFASLALCVITAGVAVVALQFQFLPGLKNKEISRIYVIGDSISAGLTSGAEGNWPALLRSQHHLDLTDLSRAGSTVSQARNRLATAKIQGGLIIVEIGGNDLLGRRSADQFGRDLDQLIDQLQRSSLTIVMFELPLFPLDNSYGVQQRRVARTHHLMMIPRRYFANILAAPGATTDGLHLSPLGQRKMADLIWRVLN